MSEHSADYDATRVTSALTTEAIQAMVERVRSAPPYLDPYHVKCGCCDSILVDGACPDRFIDNDGEECQACVLPPGEGRP